MSNRHDISALPEPLLKSSAEARDALRAAGISFAGDDGRVFVRAPGLFVEREGRAVPRRANEWELGVEDDTAVRNPFAKRSSRIPRWLLLHHEESFSLSELARSVDLNPAAVSRVVRALEEAALVGGTVIRGWPTPECPS